MDDDRDYSVEKEQELLFSSALPVHKPYVTEDLLLLDEVQSITVRRALLRTDPSRRRDKEWLPNNERGLSETEQMNITEQDDIFLSLILLDPYSFADR